MRKVPVMPRICKMALIALSIATYSAPAFAHPGHGIYDSLLQDFFHSLSGLDHMLAMVCIGFLAFYLCGWARWAISVRVSDSSARSTH